MSHTMRIAFVILNFLIVYFISYQVRFAFADTTGPSCTHEGKTGTCLPLVQCPFLKKQISIVGVKKVFKYRCSNDSSIIKLCCVEESANTQSLFQSPAGCGVSNFFPTRVIGGIPAKSISDFPWMVALGYNDSNAKHLAEQIKCGGIIINERWILTAAHCVTNTGPIFVLISDLNIASRVDDDYHYPPQKIRVGSTHTHPEFHWERRFPKTMRNDIALLKLASRVKFSPLAKPICIRNRPTSIEEPETRKAYIAGWGSTQYGGAGSAKLLWAPVLIQSHSRCVTNYRAASVTVHEELHVCASGNRTDRSKDGCAPDSAIDRAECWVGTDTCEGDSGGPLIVREMVDNQPRFYVEGVVSFAVGCGNPKFPGVYTKVDKYSTWINSVVR